MANIGKTAKAEKIRTQMAKLFVDLESLNTQYDSTTNMDRFYKRNLRQQYSDEYRQRYNIRKKIEFLKRKLDKLA